jgi:cell division protein FtsL
VGIVFFNVDVLRLNRSIAGTAEHATKLKQENARLLLEEAKLASSTRIQEEAAATGMVMPAPGDVHFLKAGSQNALHAAQRMTAPAPVTAPPSTSQIQQLPGTAPAPTGADGTAPSTTTTSPTTPTTTTPTTGTGTTSGGGTQTTTPQSPTSQSPTPQSPVSGGVAP